MAAQCTATNTYTNYTCVVFYFEPTAHMHNSGSSTGCKNLTKEAQHLTEFIIIIFVY